jgi:hypothetical protein
MSQKGPNRTPKASFAEFCTKSTTFGPDVTAKSDLASIWVVIGPLQGLLNFLMNHSGSFGSNETPKTLLVGRLYH